VQVEGNALIARLLLSSMDILEKLHGLYGREMDDQLIKYLSKDADAEFREAITYQVSTGGKRLRPLITLTAAQACGGDYRDVALVKLRRALTMLGVGFITLPKPAQAQPQS